MAGVAPARVGRIRASRRSTGLPGSSGRNFVPGMSRRLPAESSPYRGGPCCGASSRQARAAGFGGTSGARPPVLRLPDGSSLRAGAVEAAARPSLAFVRVDGAVAGESGTRPPSLRFPRGSSFHSGGCGALAGASSAYAGKEGGRAVASGARPPVPRLPGGNSFQAGAVDDAAARGRSAPSLKLPDGSDVPSGMRAPAPAGRGVVGNAARGFGGADGGTRPNAAPAVGKGPSGSTGSANAADEEGSGLSGGAFMDPQRSV